jgi:hypothetical protein
MSGTYRVSTRDTGDTPEDEFFWNLRFEGLAKWALRPALRELYGMGYPDVSVLVEKESPRSH